MENVSLSNQQQRGTDVSNNQTNPVFHHRGRGFYLATGIIIINIIYRPGLETMHAS